MTSNRTSLTLITDIFGVLDRHGYTRSDTAHTARAILLVSDLAHIYEGALDQPFGPYINEPPPSRAEPAPPERASPEAITIPAGKAKTLLAALHVAADCKRDRAEICADCPDQSCLTCQSRLKDAQAYDHLAAQLIQAAETSAAATVGRPGPDQQSRPPADREADQ